MSVEARPWREVMEKAWPVVRGGVVPVEFFDEVEGAHDQCRAAGKKS